MDNWRNEAQCKGRTKIFFSDNPIDIIVAKSICQRCNVKNECLSEALVFNEEHGIWGKETERSRRKLRKYYVTFIVTQDKSVS